MAPAQILAQARAAWPSVEVEESQFLAYVANRLETETTTHLTDLYLACACARGDEAALRAFEERYMPEAERVLARFQVGSDTLEDLKQRVRQRLFVNDGQPKIADYTGAGPLGGWLRTIVARIALDTLRGARRRRANEQAAAEHMLLEAGPSGPELDQLRRDYGAALRDALEEAIRQVSSEDRLLLRLHYVDQLTTREIGALQNVHGVTIVRRLGRARANLAKEIEAILGTRLGVSRSTLDSIVGLARSHMHISLPELLRTPTPG